jgi:anti-sigma-K factor RskA
MNAHTTCFWRSLAVGAAIVAAGAAIVAAGAALPAKGPK